MEQTCIALARGVPFSLGGGYKFLSVKTSKGNDTFDVEVHFETNDAFFEPMKCVGTCRFDILKGEDAPPIYLFVKMPIGAVNIPPECILKMFEQYKAKTRVGAYCWPAR